LERELPNLCLSSTTVVFACKGVQLFQIPRSS
jgi:hypothetical protein